MGKKIIKSSATGTTANDADTTYILGANAQLSNLGGVGIDASSSAAGRTFRIDGTISDTGIGIAIGASGSPSAPNVVIVGKSGDILAEERALDFYGDGHVLRNSGLIAATDAGMVAMRVSGDNFHLINKGMISGENGFFISGGDFSIVNSGTIRGGVDVLPGADEAGKLVNTGLIVSDNFAYRGRFGEETIVNKGTMIGNIAFDDGDDTFINKGGHVLGTIMGSLGDDTYVIDNAQLTILENDSSGTDEIRTSVTFTLPDFVETGRLTGKKNIDIIGNATDNTLFGNNGKNNLSGGDGVDNLLGGKGDDILDGGLQGDRFIFEHGSGRDTILAFDDGMDVISLHNYEGIDDFSDVKVRQSGADTVVTLLDGDRIVIKNFAAGDLTNLDFNI